MREFLRQKIFYFVSSGLAVLSACDQHSPEFAGHRIGADLGDFLDQPDKYVGYHMVVIGQLEVEGDNLRVTKFDSNLHSNVSNSARLYVFDSTPGQWLVKEGLSLEPQCTRRRVAISGELGEIPLLHAIGIKEIDTIFLVKDDPSSSLGELCYTAESPGFYIPEEINKQ